MKGTDNIQLTVLSPAGTVLEMRVSKVSLPASKGRFMVLYDHAPVITSLDEGELMYQTADCRMEKIGIRSGFAEVCDNVVTVCAEV